MINHVRTLILNKLRADNDPSGELIPKEFSPIQLTGPLQEFYLLLFPGTTTREVNNRRVRYYMSLLHAPEFRKYLTWYDDRLTYEPTLEPGDFGRTGLQEFDPMYRDLSSLAGRIYNTLVTAESLDSELRESLITDYKRAITDQDKFRLLLYFYVMRVEDIRSGR